MYDDFFIGSKTVWGNLWDKTGRPTGGWNDNHKLMMDIFHESLPQEMCLLLLRTTNFDLYKPMHRWKCTVGLSCQRFKGWPGNNDNNYDNDDSNDNHGEVQWMIRCELFPCFALNNQQPWCKHASGLDSIIMLISVLLKTHQLERRHTEKVEKERRKSRARDLSSSSRCKKAFEFITYFQLNMDKVK